MKPIFVGVLMVMSVSPSLVAGKTPPKVIEMRSGDHTEFAGSHCQQLQGYQKLD